ncbi:MAG: peptidylprolyl isomerase [Candidatus Bathyarchaeia archaeon]
MPHGRRKSHELRNALIVAVVLILILGIVVAAYRMNGGGPTYSDVSNTSTVAGSSCTFSTLWADNANVSGYIFETNNTGTFVNDTWTPFSDFVGPTSSNATVTKTLDNTIGDVVQWRFWCNDTNNKWNTVPMQSFFVDTNKVLLVTSMGNITIKLYDDMPITTGNFKNLVRTGVYNGALFSRVAYGFVIQGGDATPKGITVPPIKDELPNKHSNVAGAVAMAKTSQPNSAASQFFIDLNDTNAAKLDSTYSVFGMVISGMDVVDNIGQVPITPVNSATDGTPVENIYIISAQFIR